jgi:hypothetical protein
MPARVWNILMILLIGPFAYFTWRRPTGTDRKTGAA